MINPNCLQPKRKFCITHTNKSKRVGEGKDSKLVENFVEDVCPCMDECKIKYGDPRCESL